MLFELNDFEKEALVKKGVLVSNEKFFDYYSDLRDMVVTIPRLSGHRSSSMKGAITYIASGGNFKQYTIGAIVGCTEVSVRNIYYKILQYGDFKSPVLKEIHGNFFKKRKRMLLLSKGGKSVL